MADEKERCEWCGGDVAVTARPCPLSFTCPHCQAKPGEWCKRPSEHRAESLHADRLALEFRKPTRAQRRALVQLYSGGNTGANEAMKRRLVGFGWIEGSTKAGYRLTSAGLRVIG